MINLEINDSNTISNVDRILTAKNIAINMLKTCIALEEKGSDVCKELISLYLSRYIDSALLPYETVHNLPYYFEAARLTKDVRIFELIINDIFKDAYEIEKKKFH